MQVEFVFDKVATIRPYLFVVIGLLVLFPIMAGAAILLASFIPASKLWGALIGFGAISLLFRAISKTVVIAFDDEDIIFTMNSKKHVYSKTDVKGFYSYNYASTRNCNISINFFFKNGDPIDLSNYEFNASKFNFEKHQMLERFIQTTEQQLKFKPAAFQKTNFWDKGKVWFSTDLA